MYNRLIFRGDIPSTAKRQSVLPPRGGFKDTRPVNDKVKKVLPYIGGFLSGEAIPDGIGMKKIFHGPLENAIFLQKNLFLPHPVL